MNIKNGSREIQGLLPVPPPPVVALVFFVHHTINL